MRRPYSLDLCERGRGARLRLSSARASARHQLGSALPANRQRCAGRKMVGHKPKAIAGEHRTWLLRRLSSPPWGRATSSSWTISAATRANSYAGSTLLGGELFI
jgi:hypothetical protein